MPSENAQRLATKALQRAHANLLAARSCRAAARIHARAGRWPEAMASYEEESAMWQESEKELLKVKNSGVPVPGLAEILAEVKSREIQQQNERSSL